MTRRSLWKQGQRIRMHECPRALIRMHPHMRAWQPRAARAQVLCKELDWALKSLETSENGKAALEAQLAALQVGATAGGPGAHESLVCCGARWRTPL